MYLYIIFIMTLFNIVILLMINKIIVNHQKIIINKVNQIINKFEK